MRKLYDSMFIIMIVILIISPFVNFSNKKKITSIQTSLISTSKTVDKSDCFEIVSKETIDTEEKNRIVLQHNSYVVLNDYKYCKEMMYTISEKIIEETISKMPELDRINVFFNDHLLISQNHNHALGVSFYINNYLEPSQINTDSLLIIHEFYVKDISLKPREEEYRVYRIYKEVENRNLNEIEWFKMNNLNIEQYNTMLTASKMGLVYSQEEIYKIVQKVQLWLNIE